MKLLSALLCVTALSAAHAQVRSQVWFGAGFEREILPHIVAGFQTNARISTAGPLQTLFQEASIKSEHLKWFRPSIDYRFITSYAKNGNPTYLSRLNFNADFRRKFKDVKVGVRVRYQMIIGNAALTGTDLDPALRMKPYVEWSIPKTRFSPAFSTELFYNPAFGEFGRQFNRVRFGLGTSIDLAGPNTLGITYYFGRKYNVSNPYTEHILSLEYNYEWKKAKAGKNKKKVYRGHSVRDL